MYCINCGVKLSDTEKCCPLCQTTVYHPDLQRKSVNKSYPASDPRERPASKGVQAVLTILILIPAILVLLCDYQINGEVVWSGYVIGALAIGYLAGILPLWFRKPNPVIFTPCSFAAVAVYLLYIDFQINGGWFWTFALPLCVGICLIVTAVVTLMRYVRKGAFFIFGGAVILLGGFMVLVEFLIDYTFRIPKFFGWSLYPLVVLTLTGGALIYLGISRTARQLMERKFFI